LTTRAGRVVKTYLISGTSSSFVNPTSTPEISPDAWGGWTIRHPTSDPRASLASQGGATFRDAHPSSPKLTLGELHQIKPKPRTAFTFTRTGNITSVGACGTTELAGDGRGVGGSNRLLAGGGAATTTRRLIRELFFPNPSSTREASFARRLDRQLRPVRLPGPLRRSSASLACLPRPGDRRGGVFLAPLARPSGTANRSSVNFSDDGTSEPPTGHDGDRPRVPMASRMSPSLRTERVSTGGAVFAANEPSFFFENRAPSTTSGLDLFGGAGLETRSPRSSRMPRSGDLASRTALVSMTRSPTPAPWRRPLMPSLDVRPTRRLGDSMRSRLSFAARFDVAARLLLDPPSSSSLNARTVIVPARTCGGGGNRVGRTVRSVRARRTRPGSFQSAVNGRGDPDRGRWRARSAAVVAPISNPSHAGRPDRAKCDERSRAGQRRGAMKNARENTRGTPDDPCAGPIDPSSGAIRLDESSAAWRDREQSAGERNWGTAGLFCWNTHLGGAIDRAGSGCRRGAQGGREVDAHAGKGHSSEKSGVFCPEDLTLRPARIEK